MTDTMGISKDDVWVAFEGITAHDWFVADASVQALRDKARPNKRTASISASGSQPVVQGAKKSQRRG
jgi:hypothetical protein